MIKSELIYYLSAISKYQSITKAAEHLNMTQPALSIAMKRFENEFAVPLLYKENSRTYLTSEANHILELALPAISALENVENYIRINNFLYNSVQKISFHFSDSLSYFFLAKTLPQLQKLSDNKLSISYQLSEYPDSTIELFQKAKDSVAFINLLNPELYAHLPNFTIITSSPLYVKQSSSNRFLEETKYVYLEDLKNLPIAYFPGYILDYFIATLREHTQTNIIYIENFSLFKAYVNADIALGISGPFDPDLGDKKQFDFIPIVDFPEIHFCFFTTEDFHPDLAQYIISILKKSCII